MVNIKVLKKLSKINVLIVEDDEVAAYGLKESLQMYCKSVKVANDGLKGFEIFEKSKPDVVIADINLPELNGLEMIEAMHKISPHLPTIIITSYDTSENMLESINQGAYFYLTKPIRIEELQTALLMATKDIYNSQINLENGFQYDLNSKTLTSAEGVVTFTKQEKDLVHLLISNIDKIIDYMTIESYVWKEKSMSPEALRMCIKKIRKKTYSTIIENIASCGYRINSKK